jgi:hypothetical protein
MGPDANVLHSCVRISFWHLWNAGSCLCLPSTPDLSPFHVRERTRKQTMQWSRLNSSLVCAEWSQSAFSSVDKRRNLTDRDITELILESDSWRTFIGTQRHFCPEWVTLLTQMFFTQWTHNTHCPIVPALHTFTTGPSGLWKTEAPHIN